MDLRKLETILIDQVEELRIKESFKFCKRDEEDRIELDSPQAQVVIGVRRSGKSTLCYNTLQRKDVKYAYVNFDDERLVELTGKDLDDVLQILYKINGDFKYLFIDEIQNIPEWYLFVNRLLRRGIHIIITGSNAKLLSGELATHLTGRHHTIELFPFSFSEFCECNNINTDSNSTLNIAVQRAAFDKYIERGGFPELLHIKKTKDYINELVNNILTRDIEQRFKIKYSKSFEQLAHHLLNISPCIIVDSTLQDLFNLKSTHTVKNYVNYLKQAYLFAGLHKYSSKSKLRLNGEKYYPIDVALMNNRTDAFSGLNLGWRLETIVYLELLRRYKKHGLDIYYFSERSGECDFIICNGNQAQTAIQVSYDISAPKTLKRELEGLVLAARKTNCKELLLLTDHEYQDIEYSEYSVKIRPVYKFCLTK